MRVQILGNVHEHSCLGVVLTKFDSDTRGGAALSVKRVTGAPIKFIGVGEKLDALQEFHPERMANRILGMGDVVSLVEKAQEQVSEEEAERMAAKMAEGKLSMDDFLKFKRFMDLTFAMHSEPGADREHLLTAARDVSAR